jgi:3-dehydroquinate synthase/2-deoxy-scyllo-inosose synthase
MRDLQLQFEDECYSDLIGVRCLNEIISNLCEIRASNYHLISDRTVSQLHAGVLYEQLSTQALANLWGGGSCTEW